MSRLKIIAVIPARYEASRFPGKLMQDLCGKPVIIRTYEATQQTGLFDQVIVATDSRIIYDQIIQHGGHAVMSLKEHECGSDRIAEAIATMPVDIVVNVQGDEPYTNKQDLKRLLNSFNNDPNQQIALASLMHQIDQPQDIDNPNNVKVIVDRDSNALYFSRSPIPYNRSQDIDVPVYKHIGIYAFRKQALLEFYESSPTPLERIEKIECLRYLEHGKKIRMILTQQSSIGIDTPSDLDQARELWRE